MFFYTEQEKSKEGEIIETIHLVDIENQTDDAIYRGGYISQLTLDPGGRYLYFIEKHQEKDEFNLTRLDLKTQKTDVILSDTYNHILLL